MSFLRIWGLRIWGWPRRAGGAALALLAAASLLSACSSGSEAAGGTPVGITLENFRIVPAVLAAPAGHLRFLVENASPTTHELVMVRSDLPPESLPLGPDGLSVDEEQVEVLDELGQVDTRATETLAMDLQPGRYVFFCNLEGHYLGGMHGALEVSGAN